MISALLATAALPSRFQLVAPLALPPVRVDTRMAKYGVAQEMAAQQNLQARMLWIDATANLDRVNSAEKIDTLVNKIADAGFNTVVYDVKPIVGRTTYPSALGDRLTAWREARMDPNFDPMPEFVKTARARGLGLYVALNAFSEGHLFAKQQAGPNSPFGDPGWGYRHPELQSVIYVAHPTLGGLRLHPSVDPAAWDTPLAIFSKIPTQTITGPTATVDANLRVIATQEGLPATLAAGQRLLVGRAAGHGFIASLAPGATLSLGSEAAWMRTGEADNQVPLMMNPHLKANQDRAISFLKELADKYDIDGLIYDDRLRFNGIEGDFSDEAKAQFEARIGQPVRWSQDIYTVTFNADLTRGIQPGRYYDAWLAWRAEEMTKFVLRVRNEVATPGSGIQFATYVGSWYGDYPKVGVNYGSDKLQAGFPFLTRDYQATGFARHLDFLITGCYYRVGTIYEAMMRGRPTGHTVEAASLMSNRLADGDTWTYAGIMLSNFDARPQDLPAALQAAAATSQGIMIFDLSHNIDKFWPYFEQGFRHPATAPHTRPDLLTKLRQAREAQRKRGDMPAPFPMFEGATGTGW